MGHWAASEKLEPKYGTETDLTSLKEINDAYFRLKNDGWKEIIYCPKDGSLFLAIEAGSGGIFPCQYLGEWPKGAWFIHHAGDQWPSHPILWKPMPPKVRP